MTKKKKDFANKQLVIFKYGQATKIGYVVAAKQIGKKFLYKIIGEDGKEYDNMPVDAGISETIVSSLTYKYIEKNNIQISDEKVPVIAVITEIKDKHDIEFDNTVPDTEAVNYKISDSGLDDESDYESNQQMYN